jgi:hypothetical protein
MVRLQNYRFYLAKPWLSQTDSHWLEKAVVVNGLRDR